MPVSPTQASVISQPAAPTAGSQDLVDPEMFLKLLGDQLRYQDPMNPVQGAEFLAQTAQISQVEQVKRMADLLSGQSHSQLLNTVTGLVGSTVRYLDPVTGQDSSGVVAGGRIVGSTATLKVGDQTIDLSAVTAVGDPPALGI